MQNVTNTLFLTTVLRKRVWTSWGPLKKGEPGVANSSFHQAVTKIPCRTVYSFLRFLIFVCLQEFECHVSKGNCRGLEEFNGYLGTGIASETPCECWGQNLCPLPEQGVPSTLTSKPPLQSRKNISKWKDLLWLLFQCSGHRWLTHTLWQTSWKRQSVAKELFLADTSREVTGGVHRDTHLLEAYSGSQRKRPPI